MFQLLPQGEVLQQEVQDTDKSITQRFDTRFDKLNSFLAKQNLTTLPKFDSIEEKQKEVIL